MLQTGGSNRGFAVSVLPPLSSLSSILLLRHYPTSASPAIRKQSRHLVHVIVVVRGNVPRLQMFQLNPTARRDIYLYGSTRVEISILINGDDSDIIEYD